MNISPCTRGMYVVTLHESNVATIGRDRFKAWQQAVNEYWHYRNTLWGINAAPRCGVVPIRQAKGDGNNGV